MLNTLVHTIRINLLYTDFAFHGLIYCYYFEFVCMCVGLNKFQFLGKKSPNSMNIHPTTKLGIFSQQQTSNLF